MAILALDRIRLAEQVQNRWVVNAENGTSIQDVLDPAYWAHKAQEMQPYDRVEVRLETGEWIAELVVLTTSRVWAQVHLLVKHEIVPAADVPAPPAQKHKVEWAGPHHKWRVVRLQDNEVVFKDAASEALAREWLTNHEKVTAV